MADISDAIDALGVLIGAILYPAGASGEAASPIVGSPVLIQPGWPDPTSLKTAVAKGKAMVTLYPRPGERNTTRFPAERAETPLPAPTYTLGRAGQVVTVAGAAPSPYAAQNLAVFVNGQAFVVTATADKTPAQVAAALQALIVVALPGTTVSGADITLPAGARIGALRVGVTGQTIREVRRQERQVQAVVWTGTEALRTAIVQAIDPILADTPFLALADGSAARLRYVGSPFDDFDQTRGVYRRDLVYTVEYGTTITEAAPQMIVGVTELADPSGDVITTTQE